MAWLSTLAESLGRQQNSRLRRSEYADSDGAGTGLDRYIPDDGPEPTDGEVIGGWPLQQSLPDEEPELRAIYEAFDASQPVRRSAGLYGRTDQIQRLVNGILYRRNHGVISGPRGSGKTSLVKVFGERAEAEGLVVLYASNDSDASFGLIMRQLLEQIPPSSLPAGEADGFLTRVRNLDDTSGAQQVINLLSRVAYSAVVIIIDEFDRVPDQGFKTQISSLLKLSSDARLRVRFLLVGDERTFPDVVQGHASLGRHTTHVSTGPLSDTATAELIADCAGSAGMSISEPGREQLMVAVCGSPYHTRLFGLHAALRAHSARRSEISVEDVTEGFRDAFAEWESLNPEDAALFRRLISGGSADRPIVSAARQLAWRKAPDAQESGLSAAELDSVMDKLGPSLCELSGGQSFRDATAAQFLIAFHLAASDRPRGR